MINLPNHQKLSSLSRNSECSGIRLKYGVELVNNRAETIFNYVGLENVESWKGKLVQSDNLSSEEDAATANRFYSENVLFGKLRPYLAKVFVAQQDGCCTSELLVLRPVKYYANYLKYLILNPDFINLVNSSTYGAKMPRASWDFIGNIFLPTPPIETQKLIATFLDRKTAAIDTLIAKKQRLIQLLEEKCKVLINQAVTKGSNPNVPMKDSGIPWIGKVPKHWAVLRLRHLISDKVAGPYGSSLTKSMYVAFGYRVYGQQQIIADDFTIGDYYISPEKFFEMQRYIVQPEDVLVTVMGTIGRVAVVPEGIEAGIINPRLVRYVVRHGYMLPYFFSWVFRSKSGESQLSEMAQGVTMDGLNLTVLSDLWMPVPPLEEQENIVVNINTVTNSLKQLQRKINQQIEKLREYRRSLITAAVTGKLNIKEVETNV